MKNSMKRCIGLAAGTVLMSTSLAACGSSGESADGDGTVTIGVLAPITGALAADGEAMQQGAELAIAQLNKAGDGPTFKLKVEDVQGQKNEEVNAGVESMLSDSDVKAVVTGYASTTNFEIDKFAAAQMPYLIGGNTAQTEEIIAKDPDKYATVWSITPSYDAYGTGPVDLVQQWTEAGTFTPRNDSVYIIKSDNPYSAGIADGLSASFEDIGWTTVANETVPFGPVNDWQTQISKIRSADPDYVINTDYQVSNEVTFMKQFTQNPVDALVFMQYGPSVEEFLTAAGDAANGVLYNNLVGVIQSDSYEPATALEALWKEEHGTDEVPPQAMLTYEEIILYAEALKSSGGDPDDKLAVSEEISKIEKDTSHGHLVFDPETHLAKQGDEYIPLQSFQIVDGKRVLIAPEEYKTGDFVLPPWMQ